MPKAQVQKDSRSSKFLDLVVGCCICWEGVSPREWYQGLTAQSDEKEAEVRSTLPAKHPLGVQASWSEETWGPAICPPAQLEGDRKIQREGGWLELTPLKLIAGPWLHLQPSGARSDRTHREGAIEKAKSIGRVTVAQVSWGLSAYLSAL